MNSEIHRLTPVKGLRIATLSKAFSPSESSAGSPIQKTPNWIMYDCDVFRIKATLLQMKGRGKVSAWISTKNPPNPLGAKWDDDGNEIELQEQPAGSGDFYSTMQLLVADDVDDGEPCVAMYQGSSIPPINITTDNQTNDPTHKIALGGWVYLKLPGMAEAGALVQVPVERVVKVEPVILKSDLTASGYATDEATICQNDLKKACERMATAGIKLEFPTKTLPSGQQAVDVLLQPSIISGMSENGVISGPSNDTTLSDDCKKLFEKLAPNGEPNVVRVYFAGGVTAANGRQFAGFASPRSLHNAAHANRVVVNYTTFPNIRTPWTFAHELMHLLLNCAHDTGGVRNYGWPPWPRPCIDPAPITIWLWSATVNEDLFISTKRINYVSDPALDQRRALQTKSQLAVVEAIDRRLREAEAKFPLGPWDQQIIENRKAGIPDLRFGKAFLYYNVLAHMKTAEARAAAWAALARWEAIYKNHPDRDKYLELLGIEGSRANLRIFASDIASPKPQPAPLPEPVPAPTALPVAPPSPVPARAGTPRPEETQALLTRRPWLGVVAVGVCLILAGLAWKSHRR